MEKNVIKVADERNMERNNKSYDRCNHCVYFDKKIKTVRYYGHSSYKCPLNPNHNPRPNRKACEYFKDKYKAEDGDFCERKCAPIVKSRSGNEIIPCNNCDIRCIFAIDKSERNYLRKGSNNATQTT